MMHEFFKWFLIGGLAWGGTIGIVVLFLQGVHRDDDDDEWDVNW